MLQDYVYELIFLEAESGATTATSSPEFEHNVEGKEYEALRTVLKMMESKSPEIISEARYFFLH